RRLVAGRARPPLRGGRGDRTQRRELHRLERRRGKCPPPAALHRAGQRGAPQAPADELTVSARAAWTISSGRAGQLIARAAALRRPGPYQLQAAIVACHAEAPRWEDTDWPQIFVL